MRLILFALLLAANVASAQTLPTIPAPGSSAPAAAPRAPVVPAVGAEWLTGAEVDLRLLDKVTARVSSATAKIGTNVTFGTLSIAVRSCLLRPADRAADSAAFLEISDRNGLAGFRGWMFANAPALAMLEHPGYDVKVAACRP